MPPRLSGKTIIGVRTNIYNLGVIFTSRLRAYDVTGNSPVLAKNTNIPLIFIYLD